MEALLPPTFTYKMHVAYKIYIGLYSFQGPITIHKLISSI